MGWHYVVRFGWDVDGMMGVRCYLTCASLNDVVPDRVAAKVADRVGTTTERVVELGLEPNANWARWMLRPLSMQRGCCWDVRGRMLAKLFGC